MTEKKAEIAHTRTCDRCGHGIPFVHDLTPAERRLAEHFLSEVYSGHGEPTRRSFPPAPVERMLRDDPHYFLCQEAIRDARRLLSAFPALAVPLRQCCDLHGRNCEPKEELCCERCTEATHPQHRDGSACSNPDLSIPPASTPEEA